MQFSTTQNTQNTQEAQQKHTQIDKEGIAKLMDLFYAKVRKDENLGRIFEGRIGTDEASWSAHKQKIASFWGGIFLGEQDYHGAPLKAHLDLEPFPREFFEIWLGLFKESCEAVFCQEAAEQLLDRARDIAQRFQKILYEFPHS